MKRLNISSWRFIPSVFFAGTGVGSCHRSPEWSFEWNFWRSECGNYYPCLHKDLSWPSWVRWMVLHVLQGWQCMDALLESERRRDPDVRWSPWKGCRKKNIGNGKSWLAQVQLKILPGRSRSWVFSVTSYACKSISMWAFPLRQWKIDASANFMIWLEHISILSSIPVINGSFSGKLNISIFILVLMQN